MKKSPLVPIFLIVLVDILGLTLILPLLPIYAEHLGATPFQAGLLISVYGFCQLLAGPVLGQMSDRVGRKPILIVSQVGTLIGFVVLAYAKNIQWVFISRIIDGLTAGNISVAQAYVSDVSAPENRARSFGLIGVAFGIGFLIGPAAAGYLAQFGYQVPIFGAVALSATSILATTLLLPRRTEEQHMSQAPAKILNVQAYRVAFQSKPVALLLWQFLCFTFSFSMFMSGFALFAERRFLHGGVRYGVREVGYVLAFMGGLGIVIQTVLLPKLIRLFREVGLVKLGFACTCIGFAILGRSYQTASLMIAVTLVGFGSSILRPCVTSLVSVKSGRDKQGMTIGLMQSLMSLSQIVAPMVGAFLIQHEWLASWAWLAGVTTIIGLFLTRTSATVS